MNAHPWVLVAPWYRWPRAGVPGSGRGTPPAIQKFSSDTYVLDFLANPQHSLQFDDLVDRVQTVRLVTAPKPLAVALATKFSSLFVPKDKDGKPSAIRASLEPSALRKIYLDTHSRHYLVVCELHCDLAGFPSPDSREVCQAGLVVRRRHLAYPEVAKAEARAIVGNLVAVESAIAARQQGPAGGDCGCGSRKTLAARLRALFKATQPSLPELLAKRDALNAQLAAWRSASGASWVQEGWLPGDRDRIGAWQVVEDEPQDLLESWFPMWPLFADPAKPEHDATGRTIYYGVLPTASFDTDAFGKARFDDQTSYEIRCFVRRHDPRCPRGETPDCQGQLIWSLATESYRLAPQFDLQGTSNRPVTIQMPDLAELAAQVGQKAPLGKFSPVKVIQPQALAPTVDGKACTGGSMGGPAICFISIPLITIVALFVFNLFLPIVVFIFGLWFLLALKFCIPPQLALDLSLSAKITALDAKLDLVAAAGVDLDADFPLSLGFTADDLNRELAAGLSAGFSASYGFDAGPAEGNLGAFSNVPLGDMTQVAVAIKGLPADVAADPPVRGDIEARVVFETRRTPEGAPA